MLTAIDIDPFVTAIQKAPELEQLEDWANAGPALTAEATSARTDVATASKTMPNLLTMPVLGRLSTQARSLVCFDGELMLPSCIRSISFIIMRSPFGRTIFYYITGK